MRKNGTKFLHLSVCSALLLCRRCTIIFRLWRCPTAADGKTKRPCFLYAALPAKMTENSFLVGNMGVMFSSCMFKNIRSSSAPVQCNVVPLDLQQAAGTSVSDYAASPHCRNSLTKQFEMALNHSVGMGTDPMECSIDDTYPHVMHNKK